MNSAHTHAGPAANVASAMIAYSPTTGEMNAKPTAKFVQNDSDRLSSCL